MMSLSRSIFTLLLGAALIFSVTNVFADKSAQRNLVKEEANRQLVVEFYNQFFNEHQVQQASKVVADNYIQHNPDVPNGKAPFVSYFQDYFKNNPQSKATIVRSATDNDLVFLHVHSTENTHDRGQAVVDIFRVENGIIVEHWDVIQDVPQKSANNNTMF